MGGLGSCNELPVNERFRALQRETMSLISSPWRQNIPGSLESHNLVLLANRTYNFDAKRGEQIYEAFVN
jgi:hypothetical protein